MIEIMTDDEKEKLKAEFSELVERIDELVWENAKRAAEKQFQEYFGRAAIWIDSDLKLLLGAGDADEFDSVEVSPTTLQKAIIMGCSRYGELPYKADLEAFIRALEALVANLKTIETYDP